jgi:hypothetical protein
MAWTRGVWGSLAVVALAQLGTDAFYTITDHWAHLGGFLTGAIVGLAMSPALPGKTVALHVARGVTVLFAALAIVSFAFVVRTSIRDSLETSPDLWVDVVELDKIPATGNIDAYITGTPVRAMGHHQVDRAVPATDSLVPMPDGWTGTEFVGALPSALGDDQRMRIIVARSETVVITLYVPESIVRAAPEYFTWLVPRL